MEVLGPLPCEPSLDGIMRYVQAQVNDWLPRWQKSVAEQPERFGQVEAQILAVCRSLAGPLTAAVLCAPEVHSAVQRRAEELVRQSPRPLRKVEYGPRWVGLLCGLTLNMLCWYWAPRSGPQRADEEGRAVGKRGKRPVGMYPEWAALGIREGASPQLQSESARLVALLPSLRLAGEELGARGCQLDDKALRRITLEVGGQALARRKDDLALFRTGNLPAGEELRGRRVAVLFDGGRARTRLYKKNGPRTKKGRKRFEAPWREPKLLVIHVLDKRGRLDRSVAPFIDVTLQGADALMELAAFHLHRLGAAFATAGIFLADGADWIWDRIPAVMQRAGLPAGLWRKALDFCHAVGHIATALEACKDLSPQERKGRLQALRKQLRQGNAAAVIDSLRRLCRGRRSQAVRKELDYLLSRLELLDYGRLRRHRLPIGSGAVESAIRRILNLRLKGAGIFWDEENLEKVAYLRAQLLTGRWEEMMRGVLSHAQRTRDLIWRWKPTSMTTPTPTPSQSTEISALLAAA